jgi:ketosteroid isomerase-like protein
MSQENVEICTRLFELFSGLDPVAGVEASLEYTDPDGELESAIIGGAEGTAYRGHGEFRQWAADVETVFETLRTTPEEYRDIGDGRVLMLGHVSGRGRESGIALEAPIAFLCTLRAGRISYMQGFLSWDQALEAAGQPEA